MSNKPTKAWVAWSSGKDSLWALHIARQSSELEITGLLTTITEPYARVSMHAVRDELLDAQAAALSLPVYRVPIPAPCSDEIYNAAMQKALAQARDMGVTKIVFGDLYLTNVRAYREERMAGTGIDPVFPLWGLDTTKLSREMIANGVRAYVTCLDPRKINKELVGSSYDETLLSRLPLGTDPCAENGEFHTFVWDGPEFTYPLSVQIGEIVERAGFVFADVISTLS